MTSVQLDLATLTRVRGLSIQEVADRAGMDRARVSRLLHGKEPMTPQARRRIERALWLDLLGPIAGAEHARR